MTPHDIAELFSGHRHEPVQRPLKEAQVATLLEEYARYEQPCPFKAGDIITPRATSTYSNQGEPHIVLEVLELPIYVRSPGHDLDDVFSHALGQRLDIRVAVINDQGVVLPFMQESWRHEPYTGPMPHVAG